MNSLTDPQLLRDYSEHRSEAAFAELVRRHVDFVHSAALRMVRDAHLAEDVTQAVFMALAKNARQLTDRPILSGWLHRTTQNLAANTVRTDVRRRAREQEAATMNETLSAETDTAWELIAPRLDEALNELSEPDRDALLLRYFERKSAREMAQTLGLSDAAAQKRVSRAVEKLREFFAKRGVAVGASGLAVVLSANAVQAAPVGLAVTISTTAALAGTTIAASTATIIPLKLMSTAALKPILVASAAIAASLVIVVQHNRAERLREQLESLQAQVQKTETSSAELSERLQTSTRERESDPRKEELLRLRAEANRLRGLETELAKLRAESLRQQEQNRLARATQAAAQEAIEKFEGQRALTVNALKQVGMELHGLAAQNKLNFAFTADGNLNPSLLITQSDPNFDSSNVELLVNDPAQLAKLLEGGPETIVARTAEPIPTPDGRWLRVYTLADGSVRTYATESPNQAFTGKWQLENLKPRP